MTVVLRLYIFFYSLTFIPFSFGQIKRIRAWDLAENIKHLSVFEMTELDTIFPAPALLPEPGYSLNGINTIKWNNDSIHTELEKLKISLIVYEVQARFNQTELWGFVDASVDSATFIHLPAGLPIEYRLRYLGRDSTGEYGLSYWSEPEISIQDLNPPTIHQLEIIDLQQGENTAWIIGNEISYHIIATDSVLGVVEKICIRELSGFVDKTDTTTVDPPLTYLDSEFSYSLSTPEQEPLSLQFWVIDRAGRESLEKEFTLFWMTPSSKIFCFPNPFNPKEGEVSAIKIEDQNVEEVRIYDLFGNLVRKLKRTSGSYFFEWDGRNGKDKLVATGGYICVVPGSNDLYCKIAVVR